MADYKGKLTGQQIDELPEKVGELEPNEVLAFENIAKMARVAYQHVTQDITTCITDFSTAKMNPQSNIDLDTGGLVNDEDYDVYQGFMYKIDKSKLTTYGTKAVIGFYTGPVASEEYCVATVDLSEYSGEKILINDILPREDDHTFLYFHVSCLKDKAEDFSMIRVFSNGSTFRNEIYNKFQNFSVQPVYGEYNETYVSFTPYISSSKDVVHIFTTPLRYINIWCSNYFNQGAGCDSVYTAYFTVADNVSVDADGYATDVLHFYNIANVHGIIGDFRVKPGKSYVFSNHRDTMILQELDDISKLNQN